MQIRVLTWLLVIITLLCLIGTVLAEESFYPTTIAQLTARATLSGTGTVTGLAKGEVAKFQTLTFQESEFQKVTIVTEALHINGKTITPKYVLDEFNNKYVSFEIPENGEFTYQLIADINARSNLYQMTDYPIMSTTNKEAQLYLKPTEKVESDSTEILTLAKNKIATNSFLDAINQTVEWVNDYVEYAQGKDFYKYYISQFSAIETLLAKKGVCDEFSNLGAALLRAKGIPTRLAIGITFDGKDWGNHAWIEVWHEQFGWIPSDPTFRESGFVDATHLKMGSFDDVAKSNAKCFFPSTASCQFQTQQKLPDIQVLSKAYFDEVGLSVANNELIANTWNTVTLTLTNKTHSVLTTPVSIKETYSELIVQDKKQSVILNPLESKTVTFKIYPNLKLAQNQLAKGTITFNSLASPTPQEFTIRPGTDTNQGPVIVEDITPIAHNNELTIQITTSNYSLATAPVDINITSDTTHLTSHETITTLTTQTFSKKITDFNEIPYTVYVVTPTMSFTQTIVPLLQKTPVSTAPVIKETVVEQKITSTVQTQPLDIIAHNPLIIVVALLMGVAILLFGLFYVNKRYV